MNKKMVINTFILVILITFFLTTSFVLSQEINNVNSKIMKINIYPNSAMFYRQGKVELDKGLHRIVFDDVLEKFDENTINVTLAEINDKIANIIGVSVETVFLDEDPLAKTRELKDDISQLEKEIRKINSEKNILKDKKEFLNSIIYFLSEQNKRDNINLKIPSIEEFESTYSFLDEKLKIYYEQDLNYDFKIESSQEKISLLQKQLQQITSGKQNTKKIIAIDLEVYQKADLDILLTYQADEKISWRPVYDVKANIKENSIEIFTYASINQLTGSDWNDIFVSLSTARPTVSGAMPVIKSWFLKPYQIQLEGQRMDKAMGVPGLYEEELEAISTDSSQKKSVIMIEDKGTSVTFHIPQKISISSGSSQEKILISKEKLSGRFNYKTYPRESPYVYFNVYIDNILEIPLLSGEVNLFLDGSFTGKTSLGYISPGEKFDISLGIAENVKVQRMLIKKFRDETLIAAIPSSKISTKYEYKILIENFQNTETLCNIFENIPVPEDDRIQVKIDQVSIEPNLKDWDDKKGVWMWEMLLQPMEKIEINIIYSVIHPRDLQIIGLP